MRWSQPTFIGILPAALIWTSLFGVGTVSLQNFTLLHAMLLTLGVYLFVVKYTSPPAAALLTGALVLSETFVIDSVRFMTDIPFATYMFWFLLVHRTLETRDREELSKPIQIGLWIAWAVLLLLTILTRAFALIFAPVLLVQWLFPGIKQQRSNAPQISALNARLDAAAPPPSRFQDRFLLFCAILSLLILLVFFVTVRLLAVHGFSFLELTVVRQVFLQHDRNRLEIRVLIASLWQSGALLSPVLLLCGGARRERIRAWEIVALVILTSIGLPFWKRGLIPPLMTLPNCPGVLRLFTLLTTLLGPIGILMAIRVVRKAWRRSHPSTTLLLTAVVLAHFAILPIMLHPLFRHVLPAFIAMLLLTTIAGVDAQPPFAMVCLLAILMIGGYNVVMVGSSRETDGVRWRMASTLVRSGVSPLRIDADWNWFCLHELRPDRYTSEFYVARYARYVKQARYKIDQEKTLQPLMTPSTHLLARRVVHTWIGDLTLATLDLGQSY